MCEAADAPVVKISAVCTTALACAGGMPSASIADVDTTPNAMPSAPSTNCAAKPMATSASSSGVKNSDIVDSARSAWLSVRTRDRGNRSLHDRQHDGDHDRGNHD